MIQFFAEGTPVPAMRVNRNDSYTPKTEKQHKRREKIGRMYAWRERVTLKARQFKREFAALKYPVKVDLVFALENPSANIDADNIFKSTTDALVYAEFLKGDSLKYIRAIAANSIKATEAQGCLITITEMEV